MVLAWGGAEFFGENEHLEPPSSTNSLLKRSREPHKTLTPLSTFPQIPQRMYSSISAAVNNPLAADQLAQTQASPVAEATNRLVQEANETIETFKTLATRLAPVIVCPPEDGKEPPRGQPVPVRSPHTEQLHVVSDQLLALRMAMNVLMQRLEL